MLDHTNGNVPLSSTKALTKGTPVKRRVPLVSSPRFVAGPGFHAPQDFPWSVRSRSHPQATGTGTHCPVSGLWSAAVDGKDVTVLLLEGQMMPAASGQPVQWAFVAPVLVDEPETPRRQ